MRATFEPYKTFPSDSSLAISLPRAKRIYDEFTPLTIIVNRPPNATEYRRFLNMVDELEAFPTAYGPDRTQLLLRTYEKYDRAAFQVAVDWGEAKPDDYHFNYNNLPNYIKSNKEAFQNDVKFDVDQKGQVTLSSFSFLLVGRQLSEWCERAVFLRNVRGVLARYSDFQALPYDLDASLLDLMLTVKGSLITSSIVTLFCMAAVCVLFIQNKIGVAIVTSAIASICFTLLGLQSWAGADLDPVTMVNMLMAVGFSVDYTAHTVYHYYKGEEQLSPIDRLASTLKAVAWPMIQAGLSTAICMVPLMFLTTYAILAFAKTVFIVVAVGFFHGLFVLPVVLTALPYSFAVHDRCCRRRRNLPAKQYFIDEKLTYNDSEKLSPCTDNLL
uniref:Patched family protein n=1 Tax=Plectus sambesii TaxID=2011161 RepID=A0A914XEB2_9BILA